jgi:diadenosine tetraphosphate (Ap4A) HIT family hydrolase
MSGCLACDLLDGTRSVPGGTVLDDEYWVAEHCLGPFGPGAFVVKTKAHRDSLWTMTDAEAERLGPILRRVSRAIVDALGAERVYVTMWVDAPPHHMHLVLWPRYPEEERGLELQVRRKRRGVPTADAMEDAARRVKQQLET